MGITTGTVSVPDINPYAQYDYNLNTVPGTTVSVKLIPDPAPPSGLGRWFNVRIGSTSWSGVKIVTGGAAVTKSAVTNSTATFVRVDPAYTDSHGAFTVTYSKPY